MRWTRAIMLLGASAALCCVTQIAQAAPTAKRATDPLTVLAEPQAGVAPFLKMINGARTSIDLTMYELFDQGVEQALVAAEHRGVDVRVLLNGGYYSENWRSALFEPCRIHWGLTERQRAREGWFDPRSGCARSEERSDERSA